MFSFLQTLQSSAVLFPGQGSQQVGMGSDLLATYPAARVIFDEADEILGFALSRLCFEGPEAELTDTINVQPALLTVSVALLHALESEFGDRQGADGSATFVAGHSLGEYTALVAAGSLSFPDGLRLVRERGRLMKEAGATQPGMMAAILGLEEAQVAAVCNEVTRNGGIAVVANDNCPGQVVISGDQTGMEAVMPALTTAGARKVVPLAVSVASHSPLMQPVTDQLRETIAAATIIAPQIPVIGNTTARPLTTVAAIREELAAQLTGSVRWTASMQFAVEQGITNFIEIGPGDVLSGLMRRIDRKVNRQNISDAEGVQAFIQNMQ
ncbi:MAG: ACP S-malonyltransferase [Caldilineaceae bacterium]